MGNTTCQIIIDGEEKQITLQEDIAAILRIFNRDTADELTLKKLGRFVMIKIIFISQVISADIVGAKMKSKLC